MSLYRKFLTVQLSLTLLLAACGGAASATVDANTMMTRSVGSMVASFFGTQTAMYTPASPTSTVTQTPFPTPTVLTATFPPGSTPTFTVRSLTPGTVTVTTTGTLSTATVNPGSLAVGCNNLAFIRDVNLPAGTVVQKNQDMTKTWKVENNGTCNWMYQYSLVLLSGDAFGASGTKIQKQVAPGSWSELSIQFTTPNKPGTYTSYWRLSNGQSMFGATLALSFVVAAPSSTSAPATAVPTSTVTPTATTAPSNTPTPTETSVTP
jgi:hypothetical protein